MSKENTQHVERIKKLVLAMEELDGTVVAAVQMTIRVQYPPIQPTDTIEEYMAYLRDASKACGGSNYDYASMIQYLLGTPRDKDAWIVTLAFLEEKFLGTPDVVKSIWRSRIVSLQKAAMKVVAAVEADQVFVPEEVDVVTAMVKKFNALDSFLEDVPEFIKQEEGMMESFSDELENRFDRPLRKTITYLQDLGRVGPKAGRYEPQVTPEEYSEALTKVRERSKSESTPRKVSVAKSRISPESHLFQDKNPTNVAAAYDQKSNKWNPTIIALVSVLVFLAGIPGVIAWTRSPHRPGSRSDPDFWFLIQSSILQVVSLITIVVSLQTRSRSPRQPWFWTWGFVVMSLICAVAAIPLYLFVPTEWSATVSFAGGVSQAFVVLQSVFLID
ncbi:hypothetical protein F5884DRAFT_526387 [Xylogone sp. PMI_703]|nr:hypothetical protein F5884DRAFT_526387 [Xylogone sp. PMI_703]